MKYVFCIDETGSFEHHKFVKASSSVGGLLLTDEVFRKCDSLIEGIIKDFNNEYTKSHPDDGKQITKESLHFRNLFNGEDVYNETASWPHSVEQGRDFIVHFVKTLDKNILYAFRTSGTPPLNLHPQQNYLICLISLIVGMLDKKGDVFKKDDKLQLRIAHRGKEVLAGKAKEETGTYWEVFKEELQKTLEPYEKELGIHIAINMGYATKDADLQCADMVLGALVNRKKFKDELSFLSDENKYFTISVRDFYHLTFGSDVHMTMRALEHEDYMAEAFLFALDCLISNNAMLVEKAKEFLTRKMFSLLQDEDIALPTIFSTHMEGLLVHRYGEKGELEKMKKTALYLLELLKNNDSVNALLLNERCLYYLVHYEAHRGLAPDTQTTSSYSHAYDEFFKANGVQLCPSLPGRIQRRLETKLIAVQTLYFNAFLFEEVLYEMSPELELYKKAFADFHTIDKVDDLYARLCGTVGQAQAFLGSLKGDGALFDDAIMNLSLDLEYVVPNTPMAAQGRSFLISAYWELAQVDEMQKLLCISNENVFDSLIALLQNLVLNESGLFLLLDYMRFLESFQRINQIEALPDNLFTTLNALLEKMRNRAGIYPSNLIYKWAAVLYHRSGNKEKAQRLLDDAFVDYSDESIFSTAFPAVNRMMKNIMNGKTPVDERMATALEIIANKFPGFESFMDCKKNFLHSLLTVEDAARFLPYYYS